MTRLTCWVVGLKERKTLQATTQKHIFLFWFKRLPQYMEAQNISEYFENPILDMGELACLNDYFHTPTLVVEYEFCLQGGGGQWPNVRTCNKVPLTLN